MTKTYSCTFQTPFGSHNIEADRWDGFVSAILAEMSRMVTGNFKHSELQSLDEAVIAMYSMYEKRFVQNNNSRRSTIASARLELDVVKCYLQGMTIVDTMLWLEKEKGFRTSRSAIGRYWQKFCKLGFIPGKFKA